MKYKTSLFIILCYSLFVSCGVAKVEIPDGYVESPFRSNYSKGITTFYQSTDEYDLKIVNRKLKIQKKDFSFTCELQLLNGKLIGVDRGEWGGSLTFLPADTLKSRVEIRSGNITFIFKYKNKIYFIDGYAFMGESYGVLCELYTNDNKFTSKMLIKFGDTPVAFKIYKNKFFVATNEKLYIIKDFKYEKVIRYPLWLDFSSKSIAIFKDKYVFFKVRTGIVRVDLKSNILNHYSLTP